MSSVGPSTRDRTQPAQVAQRVAGGRHQQRHPGGGRDDRVPADDVPADEVVVRIDGAGQHHVGARQALRRRARRRPSARGARTGSRATGSGALHARRTTAPGRGRLRRRTRPRRGCSVLGRAVRRRGRDELLRIVRRVGVGGLPVAQRVRQSSSTSAATKAARRGSRARPSASVAARSSSRGW